MIFTNKYKLRKDAVFLVIGGAGYALIELLWRGRTHWTMVLAGGICFLLFSRISERFASKPLVFKAVLSALAVTAVELAFGVVFNIIFKMAVWDYSDLPFNFLGQICLGFTALWGALGVLFIPIADKLNRILS